MLGGASVYATAPRRCFGDCVQCARQSSTLPVSGMALTGSGDPSLGLRFIRGDKGLRRPDGPGLAGTPLGVKKRILHGRPDRGTCEIRMGVCSQEHPVSFPRRPLAGC